MNVFLLLVVFASANNLVTGTPVQLIGGLHPLEGTVYLYHGGWGTVCDDDFGLEEATVICRMLGYYGPAMAFSSAHFGGGSGSVLLDDLTCHGFESDIMFCGSRGWGSSNCQHSEDAGVRCSKGLRLLGGRGNFEGIVEINSSTICDNGFTDNDAAVICRAMGFNNGQFVQGSKFGQFNNLPIYGANLQCQGHEDNIDLCPGYTNRGVYTTGCNQSTNAGVICDHTPVRLLDGALPSEGRLEVLKNGTWGTVCRSNFGQNEAEVACRMLGFNSSFSSTPVSPNVKGGSGPIWYDSISCHGNETDIEQCRHINGFQNGSCDHSNDAILKCTPTDVRLAGGIGPWEGNIEIFDFGKWGTVCDPNFSDKEANVICKMLGYTSYRAPHTIYHNNYFGSPSQRRFDSFRCQGEESDISQCYRQTNHSCPSGNAVGLRCEGVQVRLAGGAHSSEGRVEILQGGVWGTICDDGWDDVDATVVCKMLASFPFDRNVTGTAIPGSLFGYGSGPVHMASVACNGSESGISDCTADLTGGVNCDHSRDAGIVCDFHIQKNIGNGTMSGILRDIYGRRYCSDRWDSVDGDVVCRELGFITSKAEVNTTQTSYVYYNINIGPACSGHEGNLEMCPLTNRFLARCQSGYIVGVDCHPQYLEGPEEIRLVDGAGPWKGRLEVRANGNWGSFSTKAWNTSYDNLVCSSLGFRNSTSTSYASSKGLTSQLFYNVECDTGVQNLGLCRMDYNITECKTGCASVGIDCSGGVTLTLSNETTMSGDIMFNTNNSTQPWSVCYNGLDRRSASVVCAMAGYTNTSPVVTPTASQNRVLFSAIRCQGWETHIGQCQTFQNNTSCDNKAFISCFGCVGVRYTSNGNAMSVNYPNLYGANRDCVTVIKPPTNTAHKLVFHDLSLAGDGDYVEIRDSPHGHQLGNFSTSAPVPVLTSRTGFYIRFKTNSAGSARGFNVSWSPLTLEDAVTMGCGQDGWNIIVNTTVLRRLYPDTGISQVKLTDQHCTGKIDGDLLVFQHSYTECSTQTKITGTNVVYTNSLMYPEANSPFPLIIHGYRWKVEVECDVSRGQTIVNNFHPNQSVANLSPSHSPHIGSSSNYKTTVKFFSSGAFYKEITGNPVTLKTGDDVFVQVKMDSSDTHVKMVLDTCYAKPSPNADQSLTYTLINNGCVVDPYTRIISQGTHETRFVFNAFEFPANHNDVYVYCNTTYCHVADTSSTCSQTCHVGRPGLVGRSLLDWNLLVERDDDLQ